MAPVRIYGFPVSTWTRTAAMTCVEKGIDYELAPIAYGSDEHGVLHPFRRIPVVVIEGAVIPETLAITAYLDEMFPGPRLQPDGQPARTEMLTWMSICGDYLYRNVVTKIPRTRPPTEEELGTARTALERANGLMRREPFLLGDELSLADLYLAPQIANCREKAPVLLDGLDAVNAWAAGISERASFQTTRYEPAA